MIIKTIGGALLLILLTQIAMAQAEKMPADSIRYFLVNATVKKLEKQPFLGGMHSGYKDTRPPFALDLQSKEARVYSPGDAKVISVFDIDGTYAVMLQVDTATHFVVSDVKSTGLKKDDRVKRGTLIGEAPWNEETEKFECTLLLVKKGKNRTTRELLEKNLDNMK